MRFGLLYTHLAHIAYMLQQTTDIVETTVLVKFRGLVEVARLLHFVRSFDTSDSSAVSRANVILLSRNNATRLRPAISYHCCSLTHNRLKYKDMLKLLPSLVISFSGQV